MSVPHLLNAIPTLFTSRLIFSIARLPVTMPSLLSALLSLRFSIQFRCPLQSSSILFATYSIHISPTVNSFLYYCTFTLILGRGFGRLVVETLDFGDICGGYPEHMFTPYSLRGWVSVWCPRSRPIGRHNTKDYCKPCSPNFCPMPETIGKSTILANYS